MPGMGQSFTSRPVLSTDHVASTPMDVSMTDEASPAAHHVKIMPF
jgi:hypothetical protein